MVDQDAIVTMARTWIDVRWQHQGRSRAKGVDCVGLCLCVAKDLGVAIDDVSGYARRQDGRELMARLCAQLQPVAFDQRAAGNIALFREGGFTVHVGFLARRDGIMNVIHAHARRRKVVEETLTKFGEPFALFKLKEAG